MFTNTYLGYASFQNCDYLNAKFTDPTEDEGRPTNLEAAVFKEADLREVALGRARLYQTVFTDVRINSLTEFDNTSAYEEILFF